MSGSPVSSSCPATLGGLYDRLYTRPDDRCTQRSEMRLRITLSGTSRFTTRLKGVPLALQRATASILIISPDMHGEDLREMVVEKLPLAHRAREAIQDPMLHTSGACKHER